jgi:hypothetical protein
MRMLLSLVGLVVVLAIVGVLAKKQMATVAPAPVSGQSAAQTPAQQSRQVQRQVQQQVESLMQQPRPLPDETK